SSFAESVSLSSTVLVDLRLPPTALELGFVLLPFRARRARESRGWLVSAQEVPKRKTSQFGSSTSGGGGERSLRRRLGGQEACDEGEGLAPLTAPVFPPSKSPEARRWPVANS